jgi:small GTP-binding protein
LIDYINDSNDPTICENVKTLLNINKKEYELEVLDTDGEEEYPQMIDMWISFGEGFLLVFAINDYESFQQIKPKYDKILKDKKGIKCPILLVGNKCDLEKERKVSFSEAKLLADKLKIEYIETSVKTNINCKETFKIIAENVVKLRTSENGKRGKSRFI